jgi:predicted tellurium resistance membrane protein TerC
MEPAVLWILIVVGLSVLFMGLFMFWSSRDNTNKHTPDTITQSATQSENTDGASNEPGTPLLGETSAENSAEI